MFDVNIFKMSQQVYAADDSTGRQMLGLDTGNPEADAEAEMWIAGLLGKY